MSEPVTNPPVNKAVAESIEQLMVLFDRHKQLVSAAFSANVDVQQEKCVTVTCPCRRQLRETAAEMIIVLDETRKSFKSKQLAQLRHKLLRLLMEQG